MPKRFLAVATLMLSVACSRGPLAPEEASFTGRVAGLSGYAQLLADSVIYVPSLDPGPLGVRLLIPNSANVFIENANRSHRIVSRDHLKVGQNIRVWTTGVERRTIPPIMTAVQILILR